MQCREGVDRPRRGFSGRPSRVRSGVRCSLVSRRGERLGERERVCSSLNTHSLRLHPHSLPPLTNQPLTMTASLDHRVMCPPFVCVFTLLEGGRGECEGRPGGQGLREARGVWTVGRGSRETGPDGRAAAAYNSSTGWPTPRGILRMHAAAASSQPSQLGHHWESPRDS